MSVNWSCGKTTFNVRYLSTFSELSALMISKIPVASKQEENKKKKKNDDTSIFYYILVHLFFIPFACFSFCSNNFFNTISVC